MDLNLQQEYYFNEDSSTTLSEIKDLANLILDETWKIDTYRYEPTKNISLRDKGWSFEFNTRKRAAGLCNYRSKVIYVSEWLLKQNLDNAFEFENILRHELAHALDNDLGFSSHHGRMWRHIARQVKCSANRCYDNMVIKVKVKTKYTLYCPKEDCDFERASHKKRSATARSYPCCTTCYKNGLGYVRLIQKQNY